MTASRFLLFSDGPALAAAVARARAADRPLVASAAEAGPGAVYAAEISNTREAQQAVLAALAGADLLLLCTADDDVADALVEDLTRLGTLRYVEESTLLGRDQVALLRRLHTGQSLGTAAAAEHLSRRTADRRLAQARAALGVRTTPEALVAAVRLGLLDEDPQG